MSVECASCGHVIPTGQFRCGKCGAMSPKQSMEDFAALTEVVADPVVPKGTFASEGPELGSASAPSGRAAESSQELRAVAGEGSVEPLGPRNPAQSTSQRIAQVRLPVRPPFLASESLREDLTPLEPGKRTLARTLQGAGGVGFVANALVAFDDLAGWLCAAGCAALVVLARLKLDYSKRAGLAASISAAALLAVVIARWSIGAGGASEALLTAACAFLPAALLFRSWYRSAVEARIGVGASLVLAFAWCALTSHRELLALDFAWQSWLPALVWYLFSVLCLLSLLAFMGDETTGGCHAWAIGISVWFGLFACLRWALDWANYGHSPRSAALGLTEAALAAALAVGLAQVCARAFVVRHRMMPRAS